MATTMSDGKSVEDFHCALYGTAIGGFARRLGTRLFFVDPPTNGEARENDAVPDCIRTWPANAKAHAEENFSLAEY